MKMKDNINYLKGKHTFALCILIVVVYFIIIKGLKWIIALAITSNGDILQLTLQFIGVILSVLIMCLVGKAYILREKGEGILKGLFVGGFLVAICLVGIVSALVGLLYGGEVNKLLPLPKIAVFVVTMVGVGMSEEFIFRGTILNLFIDKFDKTQNGIYASIAATSLIFGISHMVNIFSGVSIKSAFIQGVGAAAVGALLSAIYLRTKNIWLVVILHAFMDFSALIGSGLFGTNSLVSQINNYSYINLIGYLIYLIPVVFLLREEKLLEILGGAE